MSLLSDHRSYVCRLLASFEHCEGGLLGVSDIISDAEKVKENFAKLIKFSPIH